MSTTHVLTDRVPLLETEPPAFVQEQDFAARQYRGRRDNQEDYYAFADAAEPEERSLERLLLVVGDGLGAHAGGSVPLRMPTGKTLNVKLPEKVEEGQQIRLKGQGIASPLSGEAGDAIVTVKFERHKQFRRDGADLRVDLPITLYEAVLGGKVRVPTLEGSVELNLPPCANTTKALRLRGKGLHGTGDLFVTLRVVLPEAGDPDLESLMRFWRDQKPYKVRDN